MSTCASSLVCTASAGSAPAWPLVGLAEGSRGSTLVSRSRCAERDCTRAAALEMREDALAGAAAAVALSPAALVSVRSALKARLYCSDSSGRLPSLTSAAAASASCAAALAAAAACASAESKPLARALVSASACACSSRARASSAAWLGLGSGLGLG